MTDAPSALPVITSPLLEAAGVRHAFFTRTLSTRPDKPIQGSSAYQNSSS